MLQFVEWTNGWMGGAPATQTRFRCVSEEYPAQAEWVQNVHREVVTVASQEIFIETFIYSLPDALGLIANKYKPLKTINYFCYSRYSTQSRFLQLFCLMLLKEALWISCRWGRQFTSSSVDHLRQFLMDAFILPFFVAFTHKSQEQKICDFF